MKRNIYTINQSAPPIVCGVQNICKALGLEYECTGKNIEVMATLEELHIINTWIDKRTLYKGGALMKYGVEIYNGGTYCGNGYFETVEECMKFAISEGINDGLIDKAVIVNQETGQRIIVNVKEHE